MAPASPIKIVVIEDNANFRSLIGRVLDGEPDIQICAEAATVEEAKERVLKWCPDIALLDISLQEDEGGLNFLREVSTLDLSTRFIILSAHNETEYSQKSFKAGAKGYVRKDKTVRCLADAIRAVHAGNEFISSSI